MAELPLCVKIAPLDELSRGSLLDDGWREIGELVNYRAERCEKRPCSEVDYLDPETAIDIAESIHWRGRLWLDSDVPEDTARQATKDYIYGAKEILGVGDDAFGIFWGGRVMLLGVRPSARGKGLAQKLILDEGAMCAGTYSDNRPARRLYESLGWQVDGTQAVFHKG